MSFWVLALIAALFITSLLSVMAACGLHVEARAAKKAGVALRAMFETLSAALGKLESRRQLPAALHQKLDSARNDCDCMRDSLMTPNAHAWGWAESFAVQLTKNVPEILEHFGEMPMEFVVGQAVQDAASTIETLKLFSKDEDLDFLVSLDKALFTARQDIEERRYLEALTVAQMAKEQALARCAPKQIPPQAPATPGKGD